ncbi:hypothetical protein M427DRAFT_141492 [Gonapodya prolifera JEL478]|uniref:Uncharacterized protein n=1 Tax=Gonapodya prolifera (strain JEL478) TaxID=1344416 RepID=A0A138ZX19_GONPJ|nr:hypothetical protein M427DRAFT_141492 [Gonapodya prolifera JEL478]|eukprot:KXS09038.1 hypothetical protein M427DRAFT_141492 [Gonapodya prolifera JEL478]
MSLEPEEEGAVKWAYVDSVRHPDYISPFKATDGAPVNGLAVIIVRRLGEDDKTVETVAYNRNTSLDLIAGLTLHLDGFGTTEPNAAVVPPTLQQTDLSIIDKPTCLSSPQYTFASKPHSNITVGPSAPLPTSTAPGVLPRQTEPNQDPFWFFRCSGSAQHAESVAGRWLERKPGSLLYEESAAFVVVSVEALLEDRRTENPIVLVEGRDYHLVNESKDGGTASIINVTPSSFEWILVHPYYLWRCSQSASLFAEDAASGVQGSLHESWNGSDLVEATLDDQTFDLSVQYPISISTGDVMIHLVCHSEAHRVNPRRSLNHYLVRFRFSLQAGSQARKEAQWYCRSEDDASRWDFCSMQHLHPLSRRWP